ncbi:MAG: hypothetical protein ACRD0D_10535 [Acidimicrobiales bacterium]
MPPSPDRTDIHRPSSCGGCGRPLADAPVVGRATRQVLEIREPQLEATDHVAERRCCSCGQETAAAFPPRPSGRCAGPRAKAAAGYLLARQHPCRRDLAPGAAAHGVPTAGPAEEATGRAVV